MDKIGTKYLKKVRVHIWVYTLICVRVLVYVKADTDMCVNKHLGAASHLESLQSDCFDAVVLQTTCRGLPLSDVFWPDPCASCRAAAWPFAAHFFEYAVQLLILREVVGP